MRGLKKLYNYFFYCGIDKEEYNAVKKDAYVSNFVTWRILHFLIAAALVFLFITSLFNNLLKANQLIYFAGFLYSIAIIILFFVLKKDSIIAQFLIYLTISLLFLLGCLITLNNINVPATTFIVFLLITPMFMIDKPIYMVIELTAASSIFLYWMYCVKAQNIWKIDLVNVISFTIVGIFLNIIANSIRIREFVLTRKINIQKDLDEMTGLKNKSALTREINDFLSDPATDKGIMFMLDIDRFKTINDTFGHDIGDDVIRQLGMLLGKTFINNEIVGRFGGDEFIIFIKNTDNHDEARTIADKIIKQASEDVTIPNTTEKISLSIGIAIYNGVEKNYSEIFKKADIALYKSKADPENRFYIYE